MRFEIYLHSTLLSIRIIGNLFPASRIDEYHHKIAFWTHFRQNSQLLRALSGGISLIISDYVPQGRVTFELLRPIC